MPEEILKQTEGQIVAINHDKRGLAIKDKAGDTHPFYWSEKVKMTNNKGEPLKQWWFIKVVAEKQKDDTWWITSQGYFQRPDDWPTTGGRKPAYQPRNEKPTIYESAFKTCAELVRIDDFPGKSYAERIESVRIEADKIARWMVTESGEGK
jgi:hypothetical protein